MRKYFMVAAGAGLICTLLGAAARGQPAPPAGAQAQVEALAADLAQELNRFCPPSAPQDQAAFAACKARLFEDSKLRVTLSPFTLWGRQQDPKLSLRETNLTQFGPDALTGMYVSLFMFDGRQTVTYLETEKLFRIELATAFRNRLPPGQFPYPFWHEARKWQTYEDANAMLFYVDPETMRIRFAQFSPFGTLAAGEPRQRTAMPAFDGKWLWTDEAGVTQPQATLFDGIFDKGNPHLRAVEASYRDFAISLRDGQCMSCHVPNNPEKMKRLVLLQTPAHAAAEIQRVIASVDRDRMPFDEFGIEKPLKGEIKGPLLERARAFAAVIAQAKAWEVEHRAGITTGSVKK